MTTSSRNPERKECECPHKSMKLEPCSLPSSTVGSDALVSRFFPNNEFLILHEDETPSPGFTQKSLELGLESELDPPELV